MDDILLNAFNKKPKAAIDYIERKGFDISWNWFDMWKEAHAKAFTVAKVLNADVLRNIRFGVENAIRDGWTFEKFQEKMLETLRDNRNKKLRWWGEMTTVRDGKTVKFQAGSPRRLETIYKTNLQTAYMAGRYNGQMECAADLPYWQYVAQVDGKTTDQCRELHGRVFRYDDPVWQHLYPPNHWGCRSRVRAYTEKQVERLGLKPESSEGRLVETMAEVRSGDASKEVTVTGLKLGNGKTFYPGPGWDYNAGSVAWMPELNKYHPLDATRFIRDGFKGPDYMRFLEAGGKIGGEIPVAVMDKEILKRAGLKADWAKVAWLNASSLFKNVAHHSKDIKVKDYLRLQEIIVGAEVVALGIGENTRGKLALLKTGDKPFFVIAKPLRREKKLIVQSLRVADEKDLRNLKSRSAGWKIIKAEPLVGKL